MNGGTNCQESNHPKNPRREEKKETEKNLNLGLVFFLFLGGVQRESPRGLVVVLVQSSGRAATVVSPAMHSAT